MAKTLKSFLKETAAPLVTTDGKVVPGSYSAFYTLGASLKAAGIQLSKEELSILCKCINTYQHGGGHPPADRTTIGGFTTVYVDECLEEAEKDPKVFPIMKKEPGYSSLATKWNNMDIRKTRLEGKLTTED